LMGSLPTHSKSTKLISMRKLTATLCLTLAVLLGSVGCQTGPQNGYGTRTYTYGDKYVGEFRNGKRNGQGTCVPSAPMEQTKLIA
jgi:hypothetical protein